MSFSWKLAANKLPHWAQTAGIALALVLLAPVFAVLWALPYVVPKRNDLILLIPRFGGALNGNLKYFLLYLHKRHAADCRFFFLTRRREVARLLQEQGLPAIFHPSLRSIAALLRARSVVVESTDWWHRFQSLLAGCATKYQIWHGNGMKHVSLSNKRIAEKLSGARLLRLAIALRNVYPTYDVVFFCSRLQRERRSNSFRMKRAELNGQPRNDMLFNAGPDEDIIGCDVRVLCLLRDARAAGKGTILFCPTWRPPASPQPVDAIDFDALDFFAQRSNLLIVWKPHPKDRRTVDERAAVIVADKDSDSYPLMRSADCLVTDYSSIYTDFLLLDRPVVFFPYDRNEYLAARGIQHDYDAITPGPHARCQDELENILREIVVDGKDRYALERERVCRDFWEYRDGKSSERLFAIIRSRAGF
ncbi:MAG: CDP-glycerol glycerophosphotransferase family protein [Methylohalobius sp. ZOD2]